MKLYFSKLLILIIFFGLLFSCKPKDVKENINYSKLKDGIFIGHSEHTDVEITIENKFIKEIKLLKYKTSAFWEKAKDSIPQRIVQKQTPYVDAVSGATESSNIIMNATADALRKALDNQIK